VTHDSAQRGLAEQFHRLHDDVLVLPNAWDAPSARMVARAGAAAVASTSAGVAWSRGVADAGGLDRTTALDAAARMVAAVAVPVTVDIEWGYPDEPGGIDATIAGVIRSGAVGINLEDSRGGAPVAVESQAELIRTVVAAVDASPVPLFVNARVDTYLSGGEGESPSSMLADAVSRAQQYVAAGAHGVFVPGISDTDDIRTLVTAVDAPLNIMAGGGSAPVEEFAALGVRRISTGPQLAMSAYGEVMVWVRSILGSGSFDQLPVGAAPSELHGPRR